MTERKYTASSTKDALVEVCRDIGPDAELLSVQRVDKTSGTVFSVTAKTKTPDLLLPLVLTAISILLIAISVSAIFLWFNPGGDGTKSEGGTTSSIAVMPFVNLSESPGNEHFGEGLAEDLISALANLKNLRVVARTSSFSVGNNDVEIPEIGVRLNVDNILRGSFRISDERLKIVASLISVENGSYIWTKTYERQMSDIFAIQEEISYAIVNSLRIELGLREDERLKIRSTENLFARNSYHRAWYFLDQRSREGFEKAATNFEEAIANDRSYAKAYFGLGLCYYLQGSYAFENMKVSFPEARRMIQRAIDLDPSLGEAYATRALIRRDHDLDWTGAEIDYKRAIVLNPNSALAHHWYGNFLGDLGRFKESMEQLRVAIQLAPISKQINLDLAVALIDNSEYDAALEQLQKTVEMFPDFRGAHHLYLVTLFRLGHLDEALAEFQRFSRNAGTDGKNSRLEEVFQQAGFIAAAKLYLNEFSDDIGPHEKAGLCMLLGDSEGAIDYLEKAFELRSGRVFHLKSEPVFEPLHDEERFMALVRKIGLD